MGERRAAEEKLQTVALLESIRYYRVIVKINVTGKPIHPPSRLFSAPILTGNAGSPRNADNAPTRRLEPPDPIFRLRVRQLPRPFVLRPTGDDASELRPAGA